MQYKEIKITNYPGVYRVVAIGSGGEERELGSYRVRKRVNIDGKWTTRRKTFTDCDEAKWFAAHGRPISMECTPEKPEPTPSEVTATRESTNPNTDTFGEVFLRFLSHKEVKEKLAEGSLDGYRNRAKHLQFFEDISMMEINHKAVDAWLDLLFSAEYRSLQQHSRVSYGHEYALLSGVFNYYRNYENENFTIPLLKRHREIAYRRPKADKEVEIRFLTLGQEERFLQLLANKPLIHDVALLQLHSGMRVGEAAALEFHNIDFFENEIRIAQHLHWERKQGAKIKLLQGTKGGPSRRVPLTNDCREMLLRRKRDATSTLVFESPEGGWVSYRCIQCAFDRALKAINLSHRGTHTLRHSFAVRFLEQTKDIYALQRLLGHANLEDTTRYAKYTNESVRRSFQLFRGGLADTSKRALVPRVGSASFHQKDPNPLIETN